MRILVNGETYEVEVLDRSREQVRFSIEGREYGVSFAESVPSATTGPNTVKTKSSPAPRTVQVVSEDGSYVLRAPMPGVVSELHVAVGDVVEIDQPVIQIEAMKMQNAVSSATSGRVSEIYVKTGAEVSDEEPLLKIQTD